MAAVTDVPGLVDHLFRHSAGQLVAALTRRLGAEHLQLAEDVVQESLVKALRTWPFHGVPANPEAWLAQVARNAALDALRRDGSLARKREAIEGWLEAGRSQPSEPAAGERDAIEDDELRLLFLCCSADVPPDARVPLALKTAGGFSAAEIARAFLVRETAIAQRLVRAKQRLRAAGPDLALPAAADLPAALDAVLQTIYLTFNAGYAAGEGEDLVRHDIALEAVRLARLVANHPRTGTPKAHALAALLLLQGARFPTRLDAQGELLLLEDQDRSQWDRGLLAAGLRHLESAGRGSRRSDVTPYHLEAGIAAEHAVAPSAAATDWRRIVHLYDALLAQNPSPVVALNRAVAVAQADGPGAGLEALEAVRHHPALQSYPLLHGTRGELLLRLGATREAAASFRAALALATPEPLRRRLAARLAACAGPDEN
jgi:RNA polymerase sigma factor (sigma-70 family)